MDVTGHHMLGCGATVGKHSVQPRETPYSLIMGETRFAMPPLRSCSASWREVRSSNNVSPPRTAAMKTPSGFRRCFACVKAPTMSPTQCRPPALTIASTLSTYGSSWGL